MELAFIAIALLFAKPQDPDPAHVEAAIKKGATWLQTQLHRMNPPERGPENDRDREPRGTNDLELVLWTLVHAGVPEEDKDFERLLQKMLQEELQATYNVGLQSMILEELDRVKHQERIQQCAQFLVDNQARNGQWSYGEPTPFVKDLPTGSGGKDVPTSGGTKEKGAKPKVTRQLKVEKKREGPERGDNSNSQYAMLGLRACFDAGILFPEKIVKLADQWWRKSQQSGGKKSDGRGWGYSGEGTESAYGSMSAGGVSSLVICNYLLKKDWKKDRDVSDGIQWIASNFSVTRNPRAQKTGEEWQYYYLYGLERAGILSETEQFGSHKWYREGAKYLLKQQKGDGSWTASGGKMGQGMSTWDTCFAILFLRRATRPLQDVATGKGRK